MARETLEKTFDCPVEWKLFGTGPAIVDALERDGLDLAYIGLPPAIIGIDRGAEIVCVAGGHMEGTVMSGPLHVPGYPEIDRIEDILASFSGKIIGVPGTGSIHDVILAVALESSGLRGKVIVQNFPWADLVLEAFVKSQIDAAFGTPSLAVAIKRYGDGTVLYPPSRLWPGNPSYGIIARRTFLRDRADVVKTFLFRHEDATLFLRDHTVEAAGIISRFVGFIDEAFVEETLRLSPRYCSQLSDTYRASTMEFVQALKRLGYIRRVISEEEIFDSALIHDIHPPGDHY